MPMLEPADSSVAALQQALLGMERARAGALLQTYLAQFGPARLADDLLIPAMTGIGQGWDEGRVSLSQVYMSGRLCETLMETLITPAGPPRTHPRLAIATLEDYHLLGKRLVLSALRAGGYQVQDFGRQDVAGLAERAAAEQIQILLVSVLMLPSALHIRALRGRLRALGSPARLIVGGAPFRLDPGLGAEVEADAVGATAAEALRLVHAQTEALR